MTVVFTKDGLYREEQHGKKVVRKRVRRNRVWTMLREGCVIEEGVTLLDIFHVADQYDLLKAFVSQYSWCRDLEAFHAQAAEPNYAEGEKQDPDERLTHLEISWYATFLRHKKETYVELGPQLRGVAKAQGKYADGGDAEGNIRFGLDFVPMYELAALSVKVNTRVAFYQLDKSMAEQKPELAGSRQFSLLEVLDAIYWEISFMGGPAEKQQKKEDLMGSLDKIKENRPEKEG